MHFGVKILLQIFAKKRSFGGTDFWGRVLFGKAMSTILAESANFWKLQISLSQLYPGNFFSPVRVNLLLPHRAGRISWAKIPQALSTNFDPANVTQVPHP